MKFYYLVFVFFLSSILTNYLHPFFGLIFLTPVFYWFQSPKKYPLIQAFFLALVFNIVPLIWLISTNIKQGLLAILVNSVFYTFLIYLPFKLVKTKGFVPIVFISLWISFEYIHHLWFFNWPWLTLGNIFSAEVSFIQWYSYSGVIGGSLWIITSNFLIYKSLFAKKGFVLVFLILFIPILFSKILYLKKEENGKVISCVIVQPFYNSIKERVNTDTILKKIFSFENQVKLSGSNLLVLPESFISESSWNNSLNDIVAVKKLMNYLRKYKIGYAITGILIKEINSNGKVNNSILNTKYDLFDSAIFLDSSNFLSYRNKIKLIPIEENLPSWLSNYGIMSDNFTAGKLKINFKVSDSVSLANIICYESIFTDFVSDMVNKGANGIVMIANEQLLKNEYEKKYYNNICRIRSIENGRYLVKSSNQGFCSVIDTRGNYKKILTPTKFEIERFEVPLFSSKTFYTKYHLLINQFYLLQPLLVLLFFVLYKKKYKKKTENFYT